MAKDEYASLPALLRGMWERLRAENGVGLAAPQVGVGLRVAVVQVQKGLRLELVNPRPIRATGAKVALVEGCLSLPGQEYLVPRYLEIMVSYEDRHGKLHVETFRGLEAQAVQHEIDHLAGVLIDTKGQAR